MNKNINPMLLNDFYKQSHFKMYDNDTEVIYSTWTARGSRIEGINEIVVFGFQGFIKKYLIDNFNENFLNRNIKEILDEYSRVIKHTLNIENPPCQNIVDLHELGYLPLLIQAVPEGTLLPIRIPSLTIVNTDPKFFWLTNFIETLFSNIKFYI